MGRTRARRRGGPGPEKRLLWERGRAVQAIFMEHDSHEFDLARGGAAGAGAELPQEPVDGRIDLDLELLLPGRFRRMALLPAAFFS